MGRELPMLFSDPLVRKILDGRKRQTRRPLRKGSICVSAGDVLWVREAFALVSGVFLYRATFPESPDGRIHWKPSLHMPREASRLLLRVDAVRLERLSTLTEDDAALEGSSSREAFLKAFRQRYELGRKNPVVQVIDFTPLRSAR